MPMRHPFVQTPRKGHTTNLLRSYMTDAKSRHKGGLNINYISIDKLIPYANNSRTDDGAQVAQIAASIREFGFTNHILVDRDNSIIAGHGRLQAARLLNLDSVPTIKLEGLSDTQKRAYIIADNKLALNAGLDNELLMLELDALFDDGFDLDLTCFSADEILALSNEEEQAAEGEGAPKSNLSDRFMIPPFSVLNAREGWWQSRKKAWLALGIKSELWRGDAILYATEQLTSTGLNYYRYANKKHIKANAIPSVSAMPLDREKDKAKDKAKATSYDSHGSLNAIMGSDTATGTSIFDPVLCEIAYRWFSRANRLQGDELCAHEDYPPAWIAGDSCNIDKTCADVNADMVFSCQHYADLEVYSDNPNDLSTMAYADFKAAYFEIIQKACDRLKPDSFACFVVGEVRDKKGNYIDFVGDTVQAFRDAGLAYYNEAILITAVGSFPIRAGRQFSAGRKLGKTHQNILVFVKGDGKRAATRCGMVEIDEAMFDELEAVGNDDG